jgi:hypothetical protein
MRATEGSIACVACPKGMYGPVPDSPEPKNEWPLRCSWCRSVQKNWYDLI